MQKRTGYKLFWALLIAVVLPLAVQAQSFRFAALGDSRGDVIGVNEVILTELVTALIADSVEVVLFSGDLVNNGTEPQLRHWVEVFMDPLLAAGIAVYPCRGNHDSSLTAWHTVFSGEYALPANGPAGEINLTYSVPYKNVLFVLTNTSSYQPAYAWIAEQLEQNPLPHAFVVNHYPAFSVDHADSLAIFPALRDGMWNLLYKNGAPVFFCGHDHFYDHARIQDADGNWVHQYITGTAGAPPYDWDGTYYDPRVEGVDHYKNYGYAIVDVDGPDVTVTFKERTAPGVYEETADVFSYRTAKAFPRADFNVGDTVGQLPVNVAFMDASIQGLGAITSWAWDFGDGATSSEPSPSHTYHVHGDYMVSLTVTNAYGSDSISKPVSVDAPVPALGHAGMALLVGLLVLGAWGTGFRLSQQRR